MPSALDHQTVNRFVENQEIIKANEFWRAFIPDSSCYEIGLIFRIHPSISECNILNGLNVESRKKIRKVEKVFSKRKDASGSETHIKTDRVKIYAEYQLSSHIRLIGSIYRDVKYYVTTVIRCYNCQKFGHKANLCKNVKVSQNCGCSHPNSECNNPEKCVNCNGGHRVSN
ncbi:hypothetical protein QAD02_007374 [Eretmocerus hayati]|uniref:Uncharacterized protein n=1 Tax=Eretmocerus hayati TaxID=131215 RepID=A0ACC2N5X4_9HYME|nr:hypothetical protein QAD02_007374 [Eretmocerus hayati]